MKENIEILIEKMNKELDFLIENANKTEQLTATSIMTMKQPIILLFLSVLSNYQKVLKENETLKCSIAVANKLEELIKEDFISKGKIVDIIDKISVYKKLAKESIEQRIVIADSDSLEYGRMQAHNVDISMLQELLESLESEE